ncbi:hypothetical protein [Ovoidimarina sediminis]|uniref:hypothetical protein n=1 Tax=Ovoidimarina sediminis TaxID=3079856 RepID=UPI0029093486|nr:hypothetical protein [Rhodophyticola sp. MJ-SS7]MDU8942511.1 hypothetical protein [Rhodophyticola sp. MJ-SS7]
MIRAASLCPASLLAVAGLLSACATVPATPPARAGWAAPSSTGLAVHGTGLEIGFGRHIDGAVAAVTRLSGTAPASASPGCAPGWQTVRWADGLTLHFRGGAFAGYEAPPDARLWATPPPVAAAGQRCATS